MAEALPLGHVHLFRGGRPNADLFQQHFPVKAGLHGQPPDIVFQLHGLPDLAEEPCAGFGVLGAAFLGGHIVLLFFPKHTVVHAGDGLQGLESFQPFLTDELVRIQPAGKIQHLHRNARLLENIQPSENGVLPGAVAVVGEPDFRSVAGQELGLFRRQRRAQRGGYAFHAELAQGDHVHVALHQDHPLEPSRLAQQIGCENVVSLIEGGGIGGVEVLGLHVADGAPAEAEHVAVGVDDGEHGPVAEHVEDPAVPFQHQPGGDQFLFGKALAHQRTADVGPRRGRTDAEAADHRVGQAPFLYIG